MQPCDHYVPDPKGSIPAVCYCGYGEGAHQPKPVALATASALAVQEGGSHYKGHAIQPITYIHANKLTFIEGSVVKYITRWRDKGGVEDLKKIKHYIDLLIELEALDAKG